MSDYRIIEAALRALEEAIRKYPPPAEYILKVRADGRIRVKVFQKRQGRVELDAQDEDE